MNKKEKRILVVDDDEDIRELFQMALENDGFTVSLAANGNIALDILHGNRVDLIVMDIVLPETSGYDVIKQLQAAEYRNVPIIITSGRFLPESLQELLKQETNVKEFFMKPANIELLKNTINMHLGTIPVDKAKMIERELLGAPPEATEQGKGDSKEFYWPVIYANDEKVRIDNRVTSRIPADIIDVNVNALLGSGTIIDFSGGGLCLETQLEAQPHTEMVVRVDHADAQMSFSGVIVYRKKVKGNYQYGLRFPDKSHIEKAQNRALLMQIHETRKQ